MKVVLPDDPSPQHSAQDKPSVPPIISIALMAVLALVVLFVIPRPAPLQDERLASARIDGLSRSLVARLGELGIHTLRGLADAPGLELARTLPLGFTRLKHVQYLAERELERLGTDVRPPARPVPVGTFEPFTPPPAEPFETAGPFA